MVAAVIMEDRTLDRSLDQDFADGSKAYHPMELPCMRFRNAVLLQQAQQSEGIQDHVHGEHS